MGDSIFRFNVKTIEQILMKFGTKVDWDPEQPIRNFLSWYSHGIENHVGEIAMCS